MVFRLKHAYSDNLMLIIYNSWSYNPDKRAHCILGSEKTIFYDSPRRIHSLTCRSSSASRTVDERTREIAKAEAVLARSLDVLLLAAYWPSFER